MKYAIVNGSQSAHCCFDYTVVDTTRPYMIGGKQYDGRFESICECFDEEQAQLVCDALNAHEAHRIEEDGE